GFFGCLYAGVVAVPIYPPDLQRLGRTLPRLLAVVADAKATLALTTTPILSMGEFIFSEAPELQSLRWVATDAIDPASGDAWRAPFAPRDPLASLQYPSAPPAAPGGVMLTHHTLAHNLSSIYEAFGHGPAPRGVIWLPPYHDMGLIGGILQSLYI